MSNILDFHAANPDAKTEKPLLRLTIYPHAIVREVLNGDTVEIEDELNPLDVASVLAGAGVGQAFLPKGVIAAHSVGARWAMAVYLPAQVRHLQFSTGRLTVPLPPMILYGFGRQYKFFALRSDQWPTADTLLYNAPLPNLHTGASYVGDGGSGKVCAGNVGFPEAAPDTIWQAEQAFFGSLFNRDLNNGKSRAHSMDVVKQLKALHDAKATTYPADDLVSAGLTLKELFNVT